MGRALFPVSYFFSDSFKLIILNKLPCFQIEYAFPENPITSWLCRFSLRFRSFIQILFQIEKLLVSADSFYTQRMNVNLSVFIVLEYFDSK